MLKKLEIAVLLLVTVMIPAALAYKPLEIDNDTVFLISPEAKGMRDLKGNVSGIKIKGGEFKQDADGQYYYMGDGKDNMILIPDGGKMSFKGGMTLEAWLYLEKAISEKAAFALKGGSFSIDINKNNKLDNSWMVFKTEPVFASTPQQYKYYPVESETFFGARPLPVGEWVHVAFCYDENSKVIRTWINRSVDRVREMCRSGESPMMNNGSPLQMFQGVKNIRIGQIKLSNKALELSPMPLMNVYVNELPWQNKILVSLDKISSKLKVPAEVVIILEDHPGGYASSLSPFKFKLENNSPVSFEVPMPPYRGGAMAVVNVRVFFDNTEVFAYKTRVSCSKPGTQFTINTDKSLVLDGKKIFPLFIYHVFPEDYSTIAELGFNMTYGRDYKMQFLSWHGVQDQDIEAHKKEIADAEKAGLKTLAIANVSHNSLRRIEYLRNVPGIACWYAFDEPSGSLESIGQDYAVMKMLDPNHPIVGVQNNLTRMKECARGVDILGCDPYPIPNVALRGVYDATAAAAEASFNRKPVWTVLPCYETKVPNEDELRCMAYLAIIGGANGIGIYTWDDRLKKKDGSYARNIPGVIPMLKNVIGELKKLEPILVVPNSSEKPEFKPALSCLFGAIKQFGGKKYLFIASDSRKAEDCIINFKPAGNAIGKCLSAGNVKNDLKFSNGETKVTLPPLGAAVFELKE